MEWLKPGRRTDSGKKKKKIKQKSKELSEESKSQGWQVSREDPKKRKLLFSEVSSIVYLGLPGKLGP